MISAVLATGGLFLGMLVLLELGRRLGARDRARDAESAGKGLGPLVSAIFGLLALLIGFTFSGAASRFDARRHLIVEETNAIETAYLRLSLLPPPSQPALRDDFRQYLEDRLDYYDRLAIDAPAAEAAMDRSEALQRRIWQRAVEATQRVEPQANANAVTSLVMQSLNEMIDITTTRTATLQFHPPPAVYIMLGTLVLAASLLAGYETSIRNTRSWLHIMGFTVILAGSILVIFDYEYPRFGWVRVDAADQVLMDLRHKMQ